jgi:quinol monooxygenase YgiN
MDARIGVVGKLIARPGKEEEVAAFFAELSALAQAHEPGMLQHAIFRSPANPREFTVVEVFRDQAAFDAHSRTPHYPEVGRRMAALVEGSGGGIKVLQVVAGA